LARYGSEEKENFEAFIKSKKRLSFVSGAYTFFEIWSMRNFRRTALARLDFFVTFLIKQKSK
jgi:hypothetical protein